MRSSDGFSTTPASHRSGGNRQGVRVIVVRARRTSVGLGRPGVPAARRYTAQLANGESPWNPLQPTGVAASTIEETQAPTQMSAPLREAQVVLVICLDLGVVAATDQDLDRIAVVPGASVYPFVWNILLAARNEGYGGVLTTMVVAEEPRVKSLSAYPIHTLSPPLCRWVSPCAKYEVAATAGP